MSEPDLTEYLSRPLSPADPATLAAIERGPIPPADALPLSRLDRLLDPAPLSAETSWCTLADGIGYVAVRTRMPDVTVEMVEWWFDWHPRDPLRYRIWHPRAHADNSLEPPVVPGAKAHWGAVHHPVEDVGTGTVHARIAFRRPTDLGFSTDALDDPAVGTIVCGEVGDDRRRVRHSAMAHVFLAGGDGVVLRSHFWLGRAGAEHSCRAIRGAAVRPATGTCRPLRRGVREPGHVAARAVRALWREARVRQVCLGCPQ
jgi:hypothetical protein